ncbi:HAD family hydrolase [Bacillus shivajii]|uniref:HAD family hydrolase n=1 Tax=Bacillus shivajii TaxID=1983719 RepID=UPI001CFA94DE|nr:HAD family hydrolase [Bacillus shivajii]UCZ52816.1 HAD family hydrolase [Bacillus shivajii]
MNNKLIITDLDGTLLDPNQKISPENKKAIERFKGDGGLFTFATGRMEHAVKDFVEQLNVDIPLILYNGAKIYCPISNKILYEREYDLNMSFWEKLIELSDDQVSLLFYQNGGIYTHEKNAVTEAYEKKDSVHVKVRDDVYNEPVTKILIIAEGKKLEQYEKFVQGSPFDFTLVYSESNYLEILPKGVSKGEAVKELKKILNRPSIEAICIGDNLNDYTMVKTADKGIAVGNAHPELKDVASEITVHHEEHAIAKVISDLVDERDPVHE